jgi:hypothetical protein
MNIKVLSFFIVSISLFSNGERFLNENDAPSQEDAEEMKERRLQGVKYGMTLGYFGYVDGDQEIFGAHCGGTPAVPTYRPWSSTSGGCNPYSGDTPCNHSLPILCINKMSAKRPCYKVKCGSAAMNKEYYCGWSEGYLAVTSPVQGTQLTSRDAANKICADTLGSGFRIAEIHDGRYVVGMDDKSYCYSTWPTSTQSGGWGFYGYGVRGQYWTRFWAEINDQKANCWS